MATNKQKRFDRILIGWLIGTIVPLILFFVIYQVKYSETEFLIYLKNLWRIKVLTNILRLCVIPNLGFFFIFYRLKYDKVVRGVIMATFMYALLVLIAKFI
jgi:hypothetical protein